MANMMKDWIAPATKEALSNAYETLKLEYVAGQNLEKYPYDCGPDALIVHSTKARRVQLIDVSFGPQRAIWVVALQSAHTSQLFGSAVWKSLLGYISMGFPIYWIPLQSLQFNR